MKRFWVPENFSFQTFPVLWHFKSVTRNRIFLTTWNWPKSEISTQNITKTWYFQAHVIRLVILFFHVSCLCHRCNKNTLSSSRHWRQCRRQCRRALRRCWLVYSSSNKVEYLLVVSRLWFTFSLTRAVFLLRISVYWFILFYTWPVLLYTYVYVGMQLLYICQGRVLTIIVIIMFPS